MVFVIGGKNLVSFGAAQGLVPMVFKFSYLTAFMIVSLNPDGMHHHWDLS